MRSCQLRLRRRRIHLSASLVPTPDPVSDAEAALQAPIWRAHLPRSGVGRIGFEAVSGRLRPRCVVSAPGLN